MSKFATLNLRALEAAALSVSKEETRYYLNGVFVSISPRHVEYVATDGHRLFVYRDRLAADAPDNTALGSLIIPVASCKPFKGQITKRAMDGCSMATLVCDEVELSGIFKGSRIEYRDLSHGFRQIDGSFPDWRRILPAHGAHEAASELMFNWEYMASFQKIGELLDLGKPHLAIATAGAPARVLYSGAHDHCFGLIMPMRLPTADVELPAFATGDSAQQPAKEDGKTAKRRKAA